MIKNFNHRKNGILGRVEVNGTERDFKTFRKQAAYITQQDYLLSDLTVDEYMTVAAHLKLGNNVSVKEKKSTVCAKLLLYFFLSISCVTINHKLPVRLSKF
jgi:ABC-type multidrug transport system ATPase subunit